MYDSQYHRFRNTAAFSPVLQDRRYWGVKFDCINELNELITQLQKRQTIFLNAVFNIFLLENKKCKKTVKKPSWQSWIVNDIEWLGAGRFNLSTGIRLCLQWHVMHIGHTVTNHGIFLIRIKNETFLSRFLIAENKKRLRSFYYFLVQNKKR